MGDEKTTSIVREKVEVLGGIFEDLGYGFGIVTVSFDKIMEKCGKYPVNNSIWKSQKVLYIIQK